MNSLRVLLSLLLFVHCVYNAVQQQAQKLNYVPVSNSIHYAATIPFQLFSFCAFNPIQFIQSS